MQNTHLEKLFEKYNISAKDRYEISQVFSLLPSDKKHNLINNFEALAVKLSKIQEEIEVERRILSTNYLDNIKDTLLSIRTKNLKKELSS